MRLSGSPSSVSGNWLRVPSWVSKCSPEMLISTRWWCMALRLAAFIPSSSPAAAMVMPWRWPPSSGGSISAAGPERGACGCGWGPDAARPLMLPSLLLQRLPPPPRGVGGSLSRSSSTCGGGEGGGVPSLPSLSLGTNVDPAVWSSSLCRRALVLPPVLPAVASSTDDMAPPPPFSRVTSAISMGSSGSRRAPMRWRASCARRLAAASHLRTGGRPPCPALPASPSVLGGRVRQSAAWGSRPGTRIWTSDHSDGLTSARMLSPRRWRRQSPPASDCHSTARPAGGTNRARVPAQPLCVRSGGNHGVTPSGYVFLAPGRSPAGIPGHLSNEI